MPTAIRALREHLRPATLTVVPVTSGTVGNEMQQASLLGVDAILALWAPGAPPRARRSPSVACRAAGEAVREKASPCDAAAADRCVGAMAGLLGIECGDAVGAPLEFLPADGSPAPSTPLPPEGGRASSPPSGRSGLASDLRADGQLQYVNERNAFRLQRGQWTDDGAMSLCLADSLIARGGYHGGDCRTRYHLWWHFGYNNAFRFDDAPGRRSVGLGGNISKSLDETMRFSGHPADDVPWRFSNT